MMTAPVQQTPFANQHSIRWRLPLSYAGIALLTAMALSGLLLFTLKRYYDHQEWVYLEYNAMIVAGQTERMYRDELADEDIQSTVNLFSFVAQARVRLLDANKQVVADSGPISEQSQVNVNFIQREYDPGGAGDQGAGFGPYLSVRDPDAPPPPDEGVFRPYDYPLPIRRGTFGQFLPDSVSNGEQSDQRVTVPVRGPAGETIGYLELSEGPAFGGEIVRDVAENGVVAGGIAVLIAAVAGIIVSRNISQPVLALANATRQMAQGDLTARVELKRRDEFGVLADAFNVMAARVQSTISALRRFVADAAHEINTPLTALRTNLELITTYNMPDTARTDVKQALNELKRLEMLTRNLLALARLEAPDTVVQRSPLDLAVLARQMHERYASRAEQAEITLTVDAPGQPILIQANQEQIMRMLDNLLDNALKFTPGQGQVTLGMCTEEDTVRVWVQDTGIGIPEDDLPKLFGRFHRGRNAAAYPGNGLGLVITRSIVEEHGGHITVESSEAGTCFTVSLPYDQKDQTS
ncbi:MAG: HAMP domain-containing histidine kinase [Anaerolineae bacterium]|nr:HAMP domain-containing histidine kinase [Anaerolineae bacterium]